MPNKLTVSVADLKGDANIADNLKANKARWHKGCQAELAPSKFKCALESTAKKSVRKNFLKVQMFHPKEHVPASIQQLNYNPVSVFFCNEPGSFRAEYAKTKHLQSEVHKQMSRVCADNCDDFVRKAASEMGDIYVLAKIS